MKVFLLIVAFVIGIGAVIAVRVSQTTIDAVVLMLGVSALAIALGTSASIVINAAANYRAAALPRPSHHIDAREQHIDARRQTLSLPNVDSRTVDTF